MLVLHVGALLFDPVLHFDAAVGARSRHGELEAGQRRDGSRRGLGEPRARPSFNARKWIGQKGWRRLHFASFGAFWLALGHALLTGTDLKGFGGPVTVVLAAGPVLTLSFYRLLTPRALPARVATV